MLSVRSTLRALGAGLVVTFLPRVADACQPPSCVPGILYPDGAVPANLPGLVWDPVLDRFSDAKSGFDASDITFRRLPEGTDLDAGREEAGADSGSPVSFSFMEQPSGGYLIRLDAPLEPGAIYRVEGTTFCWMGPTQPVILRAGPVAALPTSLGSLAASAPTIRKLTVATYAGSCIVDISAAAADISIALATDAKPWGNALLYSTLVDGQPWRPAGSLAGFSTLGSSWVGRARDLVYSPCHSTDGGPLLLTTDLPQGRHTVQMVATLPGSSWEARSDTVEVDLECEAQPDAQDAAPQDAAQQTPDASGDAAKPEQPDLPRVTPPNDPHGCSCRTPGRPRSPVSPSWILGAAIWLLRQSQRRRRQSVASAPGRLS